MAKRRRRASHTAKVSSKGFTWEKAKPYLSMVVGGTVGAVVAGLVPSPAAAYAPAVGVVLAKFFGGGGWFKYLATGGVIAGLTFVTRRRTVQVAAGALKAAKNSLLGGGGGSPSSNGQSAADRGNQILQQRNLAPVR